jgi:hydrogenase-4 component F
MLAFFCAGALAQHHRTREMARMHATIATQPIAGGGFLLGVMALIGVPPFSVFMSELWIARVGIEHGHPWAVIGFVAGAAIVFIAAFRRAVEMTWGHASASPSSGHGPGHVGWPLVVVPLALMLIVGLWMPSSLREVLTRAAAPIGIAS